VTILGYNEGDNPGDKSAVNKMQAQGLSHEESRKMIKTAASKPKTFTTEESEGRKAVTVNGTYCGATVDLI
jgi:hypothetical protein